MSKIIVTGGLGFIGSNLVNSLSKDGHDITIVDYAGDNDERWRYVKNARIYDFLSPEEFLNNLNKLQETNHTIFHLGARSSTREKSLKDIIQYNFKFTRDLLVDFNNNIYVHGCKGNLIYASSASLYGNFSQLHNVHTISPTSLYSHSKYWIDTMLSTYCPRNAFGLRFFNVYGPNEYHKIKDSSPILHFYKQYKKTNKVKLFKSCNPNYPDGKQRRDFIYIDDVVNIMKDFIDFGNANSLIFDVGTGVSRTFLDIIAAMEKVLATNIEIEYIDTPKDIVDSYQYETRAETSLLKNVFNNDFQFTSLEDGIALYLEQMDDDLIEKF